MENSELILNFIEKQNVSCYKVAQSTGISESTFSKWKVKPTSKVDLSIVQKIAKYFNTTIDIILDYSQPQRHTSSLSDDELELFCSFNKLSERDKGKVMERAETLAELAAERAAKERATEQTKKTAKPVELAADERITPDEPEDDQPDEDNEDFYIDLCSLPASAGTGVQLDEGYTEPMRIVHTSLADRANYAIRVSGDSMEDKYFDGDIVLIETCPNIDIGEIGLFVVNDQGYIKQRGEDRLISLNPERDDVYIHDGDYVSCRGRVLGKAEIIK